MTPILRPGETRRHAITLYAHAQIVYEAWRRLNEAGNLDPNVWIELPRLELMLALVDQAARCEAAALLIEEEAQVDD